MSPGEIAILALIVGAFGMFSATLFWVSRDDGAAETAETRQSTRRANKAGHPTDPGLVIDE